MPMEIQRGGGGVAPTYSKSGARTEWVVSTKLRPLFHPERRGTHCTGGYDGLGAGLYRHGKSHSYWNSTPGLLSLPLVATPTELSWPPY